MGNVRNIPHENTIIIFKYSICRLRILDPVNDPLTNLSGTVLCTALNLNFRCTDIGIKRGINSLANQSTLPRSDRSVQATWLQKESEQLGWQDSCQLPVAMNHEQAQTMEYAHPKSWMAASP